MSLNLEQQGNLIATIKNSPKKTPPILAVSPTDDANNNFNHYDLKGNELFQVIPDTTQNRNIIYITAASGAGKSYWCADYCREYVKKYPKNEIYLFSSINDDSSIDKIKKLKRINIKSDTFLTEELSAVDFENSLTIFDDCDCITDKRIKLKVIGIMNSLLETGRHFNCSLLITSHLPTSGNDTKRVLNETQKIVIFPHSLGGRSLKYLLESYLGMDKGQIKKLRKLRSRWVCINKTYPMTVVSEKNAYTITSDDI